MNKRAKACSIKTQVKKRVEERDRGACIFCGRPGRGEAHVIPRSQGGLGVEQNLVTACRLCHDTMDFTDQRDFMLEIAKEHLRNLYPGWSEDKVIFKKGKETKDMEDWTNKNLVNSGNSYIENNKNLVKTKHEGFYILKEDSDEDN